MPDDLKKEKMDEKMKYYSKSKNMDGDSFDQKASKRCQELLVSSQIYKQPRMNQIIKYELLYNNFVAPKLRQLFNTPIPVFPGMIDTLLADFNDEVQIKFKANNPAQYLVTQKIQPLWEAERDSIAPNAMWNKKAREDRFNAILSGRGILTEFAENDPTYKNHLYVVNYSDFHCQPLGGSFLEDHLFEGVESIFMTSDELEKNSDYDQEQVKKLIRFVPTNEWQQSIETTYGTRFAMYWSLGLNVQTNNFAGTRTFNLCRFIITIDGQRYKVVFEPCTGIWLQVEKWTNIVPSGLYPEVSWATHENHKNFWSKSYADDLYYIADSIITMFNQELTNREKQNYNSRAYDKEMFTDVGKLDAAQMRPDALVPVNTFGGTRRIDTALYKFETPELQGTVSLIDFMTQYTGQQVGVTGFSQGTQKAATKPTVILAQQQQLSKRTGLRSDAWKEAYAQLGMRYMEGLREYMPPTISIQVIGENGFLEESELKRIDIKRAGDIGITVSSGSEQENADNLKRDGRIKAIDMVAQNPNLSKFEKETIYRDVGQFDEQAILFLLDDTSYSSRKQIAHASQAIQDILLGRVPKVYYGADLSYLQYYHAYMVDHTEQIKGKEKKFLAFEMKIAPIAQKNEQTKQKNAPQQPAQGTNDQKQQDAQPNQQKKPQPGPVNVAQKIGNQ